MNVRSCFKLEDVHAEKESLICESAELEELYRRGSLEVRIGDDTNIKPDTWKVNGQTLYIYSPTDCIRDRLSSYIHYKARECLDQAVLVAKRHPFNQKTVKEWCAKEGSAQVFDELMKKLKS